jgi:hypothetical protein
VQPRRTAGNRGGGSHHQRYQTLVIVERVGADGDRQRRHRGQRDAARKGEQKQDAGQRHAALLGEEFSEAPGGGGNEQAGEGRRAVLIHLRPNRLSDPRDREQQGSLPRSRRKCR